jgi:phage shock protein A
VKVTESLTGVGSQLGNVGDTLRRAKDKVEGIQARADALEGMLEAGVLTDPLDSRSATDRELDQLRSTSAVDADLERLRQEIAGKDSSKPAG